MNGFAVESNTLNHPAIYSSDASFPFIFYQMNVASGGTLTFTPGVVVKFYLPPNPGYLRVDGSLVAVGTIAQPVVLTSLKDDTHGGDTNSDGSATSPSPGDWTALQLGGTSHNNTLTHIWGCPARNENHLLRI